MDCGAERRELVEEERSAIRLPDEPCALACSARAAGGAEQLHVGLVLCQRRAVHDDEWKVRPRPEIVEQAGHELLAGSGLAIEQYRQVAAAAARMCRWLRVQRGTC